VDIKLNSLSETGILVDLFYRQVICVESPWHPGPGTVPWRSNCTGELGPWQRILSSVLV